MAAGDPVKVKHRTTGKPVVPMGGRSEDYKAVKSLELVHVTAAGSARDIVRSGEILAKRCDVFRKDLNYFFVARPAYRLKNGDQKSEYISKFPVALVLDGKSLGTPYHIYPFDTGALMSGIFGDRPDPFVYLEDYELPANLDEARKHIAWAFGDNKRYAMGDLKHELLEETPEFDEVGRAFLSLARLASRESNSPDSRASAIEVAFNRRIPLKGNIKFAVFPEQYLESSSGVKSPLLDDLKKLCPKWTTYHWTSNRRPDDYTDEVAEKVFAFLNL